ncbi:hypothetical protein QN277_020434 [Acacia crassicarpa]|uniref:GBF-interacting protein 1 N-terminal domain-containing protein n=1 Tax=Acacia crassicarpa TaxID=499986 RepID=A0AAE1MPC9_9FABA|nr:hypothetical protein QN277_020434 [Acacia crassicarpa]
MSSKGGGNNGKGSNGISGIPAASRKMVQSLKEIVHNFPENEIYAMLKECNMDPNEAVSRLLSQDPFHEVKSKREKKKENKDTVDTRSRGTSNTSSRGGRTGTDRYGGRSGTNQLGSNDSGLLQGKPLHKRENGTHVYGGSTPSASSIGNNMNWRPTSYSDSVATENDKARGIGMADGLSSASHHGGLHSAWMGSSGQMSMADIVKMGRPQVKASMPNSSIHSGNHQNVLSPPAASHQNLHPLQSHAPKVLETNSDQDFTLSQSVSQNNEWASIDHHPAVSVSSVVDMHANSDLYANSSNLGEANWQQTSHFDDHVDEGPFENADNVEPPSISAKGISDDNVGGESFDGNLYNDLNSYQSHSHPFDNNEAENGISSVAANMEKLDLHKDDQGSESEEDHPSVVIPNHLQHHNPECLNLSFGSFGSGANAAFSGSGQFASMHLKSDLEEASATTDASTIEPSDARNSDFYGDEHLTTTSDGNLVHRTGVGAETYESPSISQPEVLHSAPAETAPGNQYSFPQSSQGFTYENTQQPDVTFPHSQTSSQMQNLAPFSSVMAYTNSLPSALLSSTVQTSREDIPYSPFPAAHSMATKYSNIASSIGGPTLSVSEALRASSISTPQPNPQQSLPGAGMATGPVLPQHLAVHPYPQPTLPLGHFANMISYPFLPQSYTYMPSAFQQAFAGNSTYHQSLAAVLPQYKNSVSVSSLPQSAAIASAYGFGSSTSISGGNFPLNPPAAPTGTTIGYDDIISSQYKDNNHLISLQQNDNSAMWVHAPGSRTMSAVPASTYYSFQGQNQQSSGFRQGQQPSQHFGPLGYPNLYHSQTGVSLEHQQQNPREASLGGSQSQQATKQPQQLWQNSY